MRDATKNAAAANAANFARRAINAAVRPGVALASPRLPLGAELLVFEARFDEATHTVTTRWIHGPRTITPDEAREMIAAHMERATP